MAWTRSNPLYPVSDVAAAIKWYADACGFKAFWVGDELDEMCARAKRQGARILEEIQERPWGHRDFLLADPDGNVVWITQALARE